MDMEKYFLQKTTLLRQFLRFVDKDVPANLEIYIGQKSERKTARVPKKF